ncbi:hypothetical protein [Legionella bononiensis]|uniref:Uncharacterized protein n=1 Tax=Legionella bononiensis TaxID=2793102 RepID=A0ABS1W8Q2_9GAMM|nr:hypothetical protein [Legionella bononiensis]MBL7479772.1 hypothetical protein [Legionella bononiensis]MBL7525714.1 hypothetical protein [Legionella bononiensis]MBL7561897.1 hypothetical protein [Legionella bononiensis]
MSKNAGTDLHPLNNISDYEAFIEEKVNANVKPYEEVLRLKSDDFTKSLHRIRKGVRLEAYIFIGLCVLKIFWDVSLGFYSN